MDAVRMSPWCGAATSPMHFHHRRYQAISATQIVDTLGVVGGRSLPRRARRWRPSGETKRGAPIYGGKKQPEVRKKQPEVRKKQPEVRKSADLAASRNNSNSTPLTEVAQSMRTGVRLSGHTRFYTSDSLPKGLSWMPGYLIEPLRQRCFNDIADSSVTSVQGHCLRSRGLPHNAKRVSVLPKQPLCSCSGGVVYQLVCEQFRSRRRSTKPEDDEDCKAEVAFVGMPLIQVKDANSEEETSEVHKEEGVNDDGGTPRYDERDKTEDGPRNYVASRSEGHNNEASIEATYTIKATSVRTATYTRPEGHENASDGSSIRSNSSRSTDSPSTNGAKQSTQGADSDVESINEDISIGGSDSDARNTIQFTKSNK